MAEHAPINCLCVLICAFFCAYQHPIQDKIDLPTTLIVTFLYWPQDLPIEAWAFNILLDLAIPPWNFSPEFLVKSLSRRWWHSEMPGWWRRARCPPARCGQSFLVRSILGWSGLHQLVNDDQLGSTGLHQLKPHEATIRVSGSCFWLSHDFLMGHQPMLLGQLPPFFGGWRSKTTCFMLKASYKTFFYHPKCPKSESSAELPHFWLFSFSPSHRSRDGNAWGSAPKLLQWWSRCRRPGILGNFTKKNLQRFRLKREKLGPQLGFLICTRGFETGWVFNYHRWIIRATVQLRIRSNNPRGIPACPWLCMVQTLKRLGPFQKHWWIQLRLDCQGFEVNSADITVSIGVWIFFVVSAEFANPKQCNLGLMRWRPFNSPSKIPRFPSVPPPQLSGCIFYHESEPEFAISTQFDQVCLEYPSVQHPPITPWVIHPVPALAARGLVSRKYMARARTSGRFVGVSGMTPVKGSFTISPPQSFSGKNSGFLEQDTKKPTEWFTIQHLLVGRKSHSFIATIIQYGFMHLPMSYWLISICTIVSGEAPQRSMI